MSFRYCLFTCSIFSPVYHKCSCVPKFLCHLQTDTSLAIEAKVMLRWEFDSIARAASCISSWFSGTTSEQLLLKEYLDSAIGILMSFICVRGKKSSVIFRRSRSAMPHH